MKLNNVLANPEMAKSLKNLGIDVNKVADRTLSLSDRLKHLSPILNDTIAMTKLFEVGNVETATIMLRNIDVLDDLIEKTYDVGVAQEQAGKNANHLNGDFERLSNSWDSLVLSFDSGQGIVTSGLKNIIAQAQSLILTFKDLNDREYLSFFQRFGLILKDIMDLIIPFNDIYMENINEKFKSLFIKGV
jgi:hypothetical protein